MLPFAYYLLKIILCSAVLYTYYWVFLRNKIFHKYNRFYLLAVIVVSLALPLLKFNIWHKADAAKTSMVQMLQMVNSSDEYMDEIIIKSHYRHISTEQIALWFFTAVCMFFAIIFIRTIIKIYSLKKNNSFQYFNDIRLIYTHDKSTPFSFLKNIFWNYEIDINSKNGGRILKHEVAHVKEKHSHDKLFINIVLILFWCNPVFWLLRKEINLIHEFLADKNAVEDGDTAAFAAMILQTTYPNHRFEITNNFFYSPIKRRLSMLTKNNKTKVSYTSRLLVLPLTVIVFAAFTLKAKTYITSLPKDKTITVVIDAGHGGTDNGGVAEDGSFEKDINLALIKRIKELNHDENLKIILTRETDIYQDPKEKANFAKENNADLFISVHGDLQDAQKTETESGLYVFVSKNNYGNNIESKLLASVIVNSFENKYGLPVTKTPQQREKGIWVLQANTFPSVLIEAGFLSNKKDVDYLKSEEGQIQFASNVLDAIINFAVNRERFKAAFITTVTDTVPLNQLDVPGNKLSKNVILTDAKKLENNLPLAKDSFHSNTNTKTHANKSKVSGNIPPLYVINGKVSTIKNLDLIPAENIAEINVLKGDQASAKYGDKGKNGVLEITTTEKKQTPALKFSGTISTDKVSDTAIDDKIFTSVETEAQFPGGNGEWRNFLQKNLDATMPITEKWKPGTYKIIVQFIVDKNGEISDITTKDYSGSKTAQMCIDLIKKGPRWTPAMQDDTIVKAYRKQPITFVVSEN